MEPADAVLVLLGSPPEMREVLGEEELAAILRLRPAFNHGRPALHVLDDRAGALHDGGEGVDPGIVAGLAPGHQEKLVGGRGRLADRSFLLLEVLYRKKEKGGGG
jgi:hypothetical protein